MAISRRRILYAPTNIGKVDNKGWELSAKYKQKFTSSLLLYTRLYYNYIYAKDRLTDIALHYIPRHEAKQYTRLEYKNFYLINSLQFRDKVTTSGFTNDLKSYVVWNTFIGKKMKFSKFDIELFLKIYNISNTSYQHIVNYPIPLRNYSFGLSITI